MPDPALSDHAALPASFYVKAFAVLEQCDGAEDVQGFRDALHEALAREFGFRNTTCFVGDTIEAAFADRRPTLRGLCNHSWPEYEDSWHRVDVLSSPESCRQLARTGFTDLGALLRVPEWSRSYVEVHMPRFGFSSAAAIHLAWPRGRHALVGIMDPSPDLMDCHTRAILRLLSRQLSAMSRRMHPRSRESLNLSPRLTQVCTLIHLGRGNREIAAELSLTEDTVKKYVSRILHIAECRSRTELVARFSAPL